MVISMSCEKQFSLPANNTFLYCSEAYVLPPDYSQWINNNSINSCRLHDQAPTYNRTQSYPSPTTNTHNSPPPSPYSRYFSSPSDGPDIIPRFSPTISRPRSYFNSDPYPSTTYEASSSSYQAPPTYAAPYSTTNSRSSTALASLRELATALPKTKSSSRDRNTQKRKSIVHNDAESPTSTASISRSSSGVWNYMPFTSTTVSKTASVTPGTSYSNNGYNSSQSQSYNAYSTNGSGGACEGYGGAKSYGGAGYGLGNAGTMGMDRPLPPRGGPGGYGHRPRSIDLVTPFGGV